MFFIFTYVMTRVTHSDSEPGLPMVILLLFSFQESQSKIVVSGIIL